MAKRREGTGTGQISFPTSLLAGPVSYPTSALNKDIFCQWRDMTQSPFIKSMHPKSEIRPDYAAVEKILRMGWVGQLKIHGHRAQIHVPYDLDTKPVVYNRQGRRHQMELTPMMVKELFRLFRPARGWNVIDAEWLKPAKKIYVFDFLKRDDESQRSKTYPERWALLPKSFISPHVTVLPLLKDIPSCMKVLESREEAIEGLVFKSTTSTGFSDTSIVRCRIKR